MSERIHYPKSVGVKDMPSPHMPKKILIRMLTKLSMKPKSGDIIPTCYLCGKEFKYETRLAEHLNLYTKDQLVDILSKWRTHYN
jgi:hypothetical protein